MTDLANTPAPREPTVSTRSTRSATYMNLFGWPRSVQPGALNDNTNPLSYAHELFELTTKVEAGADTSQASLLGGRRPDIGKMPLDDRSLKQTFPALRLVIERLEAAVRPPPPVVPATPEAQAADAVAGTPVTVIPPLRETVAAASFPPSLPFHFAWEQVKTVLAQRKLSIWDIVRKSDADYPNFAFGNTTSTSMRAAMTLSSGFSPELRALLTAPAVAEADIERTVGALDDLKNADTFRRKLGLSRKELRQLLAVYQPGRADAEGNVDRQPAVVRSAYVNATDGPVTSADIGAAFINDGGDALHLRYENDDESQPIHIEGLSAGHVDRMLHVLRLRHAMDLPFSAIDLLLAAAFRAEGQTAGYHLTTATLRALGLFQLLREKHSVTASQFATLIGDMPACANGREPSFYDTVFNPYGIESSPGSEPVFTIDGTPFDVNATSGDGADAVRQLARGLKADETTVRWAIARVVETQALGSPKRTLALVSGCYRLIVLPRLLGLRSSETSVLVTALNLYNPDVLRQLAGIPTLEATGTDALDVITLLMNAAEWLQKYKLPVATLCRSLLAPAPAPAIQRWVDATEAAVAWLARDVDKRPDDEGIVLKALQDGLALKDPAVALPLLTWSNRSIAQFIASIRASSAADAPTADVGLWSDLERYASVGRLLGLSAASLIAITGHPAWFNLAGDAGTGMRPLDITTVYQLTRYREWLNNLPTSTSEDDALGYFRQVNEDRQLTPANSATILSRLTAWPADQITTLASLIDSKTIANTLEDLRDIDLAMRMRDLVGVSGVSIDTLFDINRLKQATDYAAFETAATSLTAACPADDADAVNGRQSERWRDALVAWMLHGTSAPAHLAHITDVDALSDYLLLDVMVGSEPTTSRAASAVASLQTYLHRVLTGLEPGHESNRVITKKLRETWTSTQAQYGRWRLLQQLKNYPENRIDPTTRRSKTSAYADLQNLLAQGKFSGADIEAAILAYMTAVEATSNIQPLTAYHDGVNPLEDTYHFIGKSNVSPAKYYWRTLDMSLRDANGAASMLGFTAWEEITVPLTGVMTTTLLPTLDSTSLYKPDGLPATTRTAIEEEKRNEIDTIRPVVIDDRRYVIWVERDTTGMPLGDTQEISPFFELRVCYCYQQLDGIWSTANTLMTLDGRNADKVFTAPIRQGNGYRIDFNESATNYYLKTRDFSPGLVAMVNATGPRKNDPWLTVLLYRSNMWRGTIDSWLPNDDYFITSRDLLLLEEKQLDVSATGEVMTDDQRKNEKSLTNEWKKLFRDPRVVQHQYVGLGQAKILKPWKEGTEVQAFFPEESGVINATLSDDGQFIEVTAGLASRRRTGAFTAIPLTLSGLVPERKVARTLQPSSDDNAVLARLGLTGLPTFVAENSANFVRLRTYLALAQSRHKRQFQEISGEAPSASADNGPAATLQRYLDYRVDLFESHSLTVPSTVSVRGVLQLQEEYPDTYARIMYSETVGYAVLTQVDTRRTEEDTTKICRYRYPVDPGFEGYQFRLSTTIDGAEFVILRTFELKPREPNVVDDAVPSTRLVQNALQAHYLDMTEANAAKDATKKLPGNAIRLNTLLGMRFAALAANSTHALIDWKTQHLPEPRMEPGGDTGKLDFRGAVGLYFWEIFLHVPMLVAWQLRDTRHFADAFEWCTRHLFDPYDSTDDDDSLDLQAMRAAFWRSRPLSDLGPALAITPDTLTEDPEQLAYEEPERFRKAAFLFMVDLWRQQGDDAYRQLTRDDINEAVNCYTKALRLIGPLPEQLTTAAPALPLLADATDSDFLRPVNVALTDARDLLKNRLFNIRHNLTIDGKPMDLALYDSADDYDALGNWRTGMLSGTKKIPRLNVPAFRFQQVLPIAREAVTQLIDLGRQVFHNYEEEYNAGLGVMQQANLIKLSRFTLDLELENLAAARAGRDTLRASKHMVEERLHYFQGLHEQGHTAVENTSSVLASIVPTIKHGEVAAELAVAIARALPRIFGVSNGNADFGAIGHAAVKNLEHSSEIVQFFSDEIRYQAEFDRDMKGWKHEAEQARSELAVIDRQLIEKDIQVRAAQITVDSERKRHETMREEYIFMTTGFAIGPTYTWMIGHLSDIYAAAYDAVVSLCLAAQDGWRYEVGDFTARFITPGAWIDNWKGMLAGEALQRDLMKMELAYLHRRERRLHIRKVVSLVKDKERTKAPDVAEVAGKNGKSITFSLTPQLYDADFPGQYLRQIVHVGIALKMKESTTPGVSAILTQLSNVILLAPDVEGAVYTADRTKGLSTNVAEDMRANQQTAISASRPVIDIDGKSGLLDLVYGDGRYLPFEGTGAVSSWRLWFPNGCPTEVEDIVITVDYTSASVDGEQMASFARDFASAWAGTPEAAPPKTNS